MKNSPKLTSITFKSTLIALFLSLTFLTSTTALILKLTSTQIDLTQTLNHLLNSNRYDDISDLNDVYDITHNLRNLSTDQLQQFQTAIQCNIPCKIKRTIIDGMLKGQVYDTPSGIGALAADLCLFGDIRDIAIQSYRYLADKQTFDGLVFTLSLAGVGLSTVHALDGCNALAKSSIKYMGYVGAPTSKGALKALTTGKLCKADAKKVWDLLKKTTGQCLERCHACPTWTTCGTWTRFTV